MRTYLEVHTFIVMILKFSKFHFSSSLLYFSLPRYYLIMCTIVALVLVRTLPQVQNISLAPKENLLKVSNEFTKGEL